jgi:protein TonB
MHHICDMRMLIAVLVLLAAGCSTSGPSGDLPTAPPPEFASLPSVDEDGIEPPKVIQRVEPVVPGHFFETGRERLATVEAAVNAEGRVEASWMVSGDPEWGWALMNALRQWRFQPATRNGQPAAVRFRLTSKFTTGKS